MDRRLQERVTGAAVLVLLGVLAIPALLDGPRQEESGMNLPIDLPPPDATVRTHTIVLDETSQRPPQAGTRQQDRQGARLTEVPAVAAPTSSPESRSAASVKNQAPVAAQSAGAPAAVPAPPRAAANTVVATTSANVPAAADPLSGWAVQVGSFTERGKADRLARELTADGFPAFVSRHAAAGKTWFRVRVGPDVDREAVATLAARLAGAGHEGMIVAHP